MPTDDRAPKQGTPLADKTEKQAAAHQAVDILHEISTILVRGEGVLLPSEYNPLSSIQFKF